MKLRQAFKLYYLDKRKLRNQKRSGYSNPFEDMSIMYNGYFNPRELKAARIIKKYYNIE